ncbi:unnamed protein product, partial [Prorocentrum cordatum]
DNATFFAAPRAAPAKSGGGSREVLPASLASWVSWERRLPKWCEWFLKVPAGTYVNVPLLSERLRCLGSSRLLRRSYLGVAQALVLEERLSPVWLPAAQAGIAVHRELLDQLPQMFLACAREGFHTPLTRQEGGALGLCLSMHNVALQPWVDSAEEAFFDSEATEGQSTWARLQGALDVGAGRISRAQCLLVASGLSGPQLEDLHRLVGKSRRWFKNQGCVPGGVSLPELAVQQVVVGGTAMSEPLISVAVRRALQDCLVRDAFVSLSVQPRVETASAIPESPAALVTEWIQPRLLEGPAAALLGRGGHELCVFVLATAASQRYVDDAAAVLRSWAAEGPARPSGVEVFLVSRTVPAPESMALRLPGDADLGFLHNGVRAFYLWRYLAKHHADSCNWFMKVDADTFVNLWAVKERLARYFNASEHNYLGSLKATLTGSGRHMSFATNVAVLSGGLLRDAGPWLRQCSEDLIRRKLGRGAEDLDLAWCLDLHGGLSPGFLGARRELLSRNMAFAAGAGRLLGASGICALFLHPVHAEEMDRVNAELLQLRGHIVQWLQSKDLGVSHYCDWPEDAPNNDSRWAEYMQDNFFIGNGSHDCWDNDFNWHACCNPRVWGREGNVGCWDEEHTHKRCCGQEPARTAASFAPSSAADASASAGSQGPPPRDASPGDAPAPLAHAEDAASPASGTITPLAPAVDAEGNSKCWAQGGFTHALCCGGLADSTECWVWPYTPDFCCRKPRAPRGPVRPRCGQGGGELLACTKSLDEIGALFEASVIGGGDKASGWHDYLGAYERVLLHLPISANVLELGVRSGSSLAMWAEYFPFGSIVGVDKNTATFERARPLLENHGALSRGNVHVVQANASSASVLDRLREAGFDAGFADVVVDDANHWAKDQIARFEILFPTALRRGGVYIIEDVHIQAPYTHDGEAVRAYFTKLSESAYLTKDEILVGAHQIEARRDASTDWRHQVESVTFMRDVVVITKAA